MPLSVLTWYLGPSHREGLFGLHFFLQVLSDFRQIALAHVQFSSSQGGMGPLTFACKSSWQDWQDWYISLLHFSCGGPCEAPCHSQRPLKLLLGECYILETYWEVKKKLYLIVFVFLWIFFSSKEQHVLTEMCKSWKFIRIRHMTWNEVRHRNQEKWGLSPFLFSNV